MYSVSGSCYVLCEPPTFFPACLSYCDLLIRAPCNALQYSFLNAMYAVLRCHAALAYLRHPRRLVPFNIVFWLVGQFIDLDVVSV